MEVSPKSVTASHMVDMTLSNDVETAANMSSHCAVADDSISPHAIVDSTDDHVPEKQIKETETPTLPVESLTWIQRIVQFYRQYDFLILLIVVVLLAWCYPPLGASILVPKVTASWIAVMYIFLISGLGLRTDEFKTAFKQIKFHSVIQGYNFFFISAVVYGFTRFLISVHVLHKPLGDGMVISACLPMAINMVIILSKTADGDDGVAVFNSAFGNMLGVFLSPLLILGYLGVSGDTDLGEVFYKLVIKVVLPLAVGQLLQKFCKPVADFANNHKAALSKSQMFALLFVIYTVFCETFLTGASMPIREFIVVLILQVSLLIAFMVVAWYCLKCLFPDQPKLRVTGLFGCTFKTVSLGVPLINSMYEGSPYLSMYILPVLMWYPTQLALGSILAPRLYQFVQRQEREIACAGVIDGVDDYPTDDGPEGNSSDESKHSTLKHNHAEDEESPRFVSDTLSND